MRKNPAVSVVVPLYNKRDQIASTIKSVLQQSFQDFEIIVVDDGSSDGSDEMIADFLDKIRYVRQSNAGPSAARNKGIEMAKGEYVAFLDADDEWKPGKLQHQMDFLLANPQVQWLSLIHI